MTSRLKILRFSLFTAVICVGMAACVSESPASEEGLFGAAIVDENPVDFNTVLAELASKDTVQATMVATVDGVCQKKGCWMTVNGGSTDHEIMVRFKDYGFFVPKDLGGSRVMVEGKAFKTIVPVDELRHYAEDAGKTKEEILAITEPESSYHFEATGVKVLDN